MDAQRARDVCVKRAMWQRRARHRFLEAPGESEQTGHLGVMEGALLLWLSHDNETRMLPAGPS